MINVRMIIDHFLYRFPLDVIWMPLQYKLNAIGSSSWYNLNAIAILWDLLADDYSDKLQGHRDLT